MLVPHSKCLYPPKGKSCSEVHTFPPLVLFVDAAAIGVVRRQASETRKVADGMVGMARNVHRHMECASKA